MSRKWLSKKRRSFLLKISAGIIFVTVLIVVFLAEKKFSELVVGGLGEQFSTNVYGAPLTIKSHQKLMPIPLTFDGLLLRLKRLNYRQVNSDPQSEGEFLENGHSIKVVLRRFGTPFINQTSQSVQFIPTGDGWSVEDISGHTLEEVSLEPELVAELSGTKKIRRVPATWEEIPVQLTHAVIAVEDGGFYHHWGISPRAVARAIWNNLTGRGGLQGGSTITQQLAKNFFLSPQRTFQRKAIEALFALYLEIRLTKEKIMTLYLNQIYMAQDGPVSVAGVKAAADYYFGKSLRDLSLSECAMLAGIIRSPFRYNPFRDLKSSLERRNFVLQRMKSLEFISELEYKRALLETVIFASVSEPKNQQDDYDYFIAEVVRQLLPRYGEDGIYRYGLKIFTSMDPLLQQQAQAAVKKTKYQAALVVMDPHTGYVRSLVGGKSFKKSQFNRATQALRQPGSAFKPFVYGAALERGVTAATLLSDKKKIFSDRKGGKWHPKNMGNIYRGSVTVREALSHSLNSATLDLVQQIGPGPVVEFAQRMGISSPMEKTLAIALGVSEVTLIDLTAAYAPFVNGGFKVVPQIILGVADADDNVLEIHGTEKISVLDPASAFLMTSLLQSTVQEGTAKALPLLGWKYASAGKTGTTNEGRDAWFIGYTPELLVGTWVGDDRARSILVAGASNALPIWASFMEMVYRGFEPGAFEQPAGLIQLKIDPQSGKLARSGCPTQKKEFFIKGTEPMSFCQLHSGGIKGLFQKWFKP